jgi:hypothetical protein
MMVLVVVLAALAVALVARLEKQAARLNPSSQLGSKMVYPADHAACHIQLVI